MASTLAFWRRPDAKTLGDNSIGIHYGLISVWPCPKFEVIGVARTARAMGAAWSTDEAALLLHNLQAGVSLGGLTTQLGRTAGAITLRLNYMIPAEQNIDPGAAMAWLLARFAVEPGYDWRAVLTAPWARPPQPVELAASHLFSPPDQSSSRAAVTTSRAAKSGGRADTPDLAGVVGTVLSLQREQLFTAHPDLHMIGYFPEERIGTAGEQLYRRAGGLRISSWLRECTVDGGATTSLTSRIGRRHLHARSARRSGGGLAAPRSQRIIVERLGLHGDPARTLAAVATDLSLSRERVRQLQEQAFAHLRRRHRPPKPAQYVGQIFADVLNQAGDVGVDLLHAVLAVTDAAALSGPDALLVRTIAALTRRNDQVMRQVAADVEELAALRCAKAARAAGDAAAIERASRHVAIMLDDAEWPDTPVLLPDSSLIRPLRTTPQDREGAGTWTSPARSWINKPDDKDLGETHRRSR
ncbi:sigma factor-like helix-turn-helix DNA-binding protein [Actinoplanes sp. CA-030573]|uniref:sigma factor-like helix-turn-helix DNA-binding protein n=1 Tax=Actinoplanes sp. CA-030573 TaxID=3239898 RepID=UPI003D8B88E1